MIASDSLDPRSSQGLLRDAYSFPQFLISASFPLSVIFGKLPPHSGKGGLLRSYLCVILSLVIARTRVTLGTPGTPEM